MLWFIECKGFFSTSEKGHTCQYSLMICKFIINITTAISVIIGTILELFIPSFTGEISYTVF